MKNLAARLGRDGSKETTLDYAKDYAERRGIAEQLGVRSEIEASRQVDGQARREGAEKHGADLRSDSRAEDLAANRRAGQAARGREGEGLDPAEQRPAKKRSMFAGLKLDSSRGPANPGRERETFAGVRLPASAQAHAAPSRDIERASMLAATETYARALMDASRMEGLGYAVQAHQKAAIEKAGAALNAARPGATREFLSAMRHDPQMQRAMTELQGADRAAQLVAGMERERQAQLDPNVRAERLVARWNGLEAERAKLHRWDQKQAREAVEVRMRAIAGEIGKDAPVEAALRQRQKDLGIRERSTLGRALREKDVSKALERGVTHGPRERGQDYGQSM